MKDNRNLNEVMKSLAQSGYVTNPSVTLSKKEPQKEVAQPQKEVKNELNSAGAARFDTGKLRLDLISPIAMQGLANILTFGARKYASHNWRKGMSWSRCIASLKRHLTDFEAGIDRDYDESCEGCKAGNCTNHTGGLLIDQVLCNAMFLSEYARTHTELDDRYKVDPKHMK